MKKYFDNPSEDAAFNRFLNLMADLIMKYGPAVLSELSEQEKSVCNVDCLTESQENDLSSEQVSSAESGNEGAFPP